MQLLNANPKFKITNLLAFTNYKLAFFFAFILLLMSFRTFFLSKNIFLKNFKNFTQPNKIIFKYIRFGSKTSLIILLKSHTYFVHFRVLVFTGKKI